ncbi:MAG: D-2-hydroxyacid dehydrogenase family protein [Betaproteobacteria bacterium]|nr:D-2-hydroxyacid dehydrogenase family protein [Betaproteobacteria bacterium]
MTKIAVLDDWQGVARTSADWSQLESQAEVVFHGDPFANADKLVSAVSDCEILLIMRERTAFPAVVIERLTKLRMIALTGGRSWTIDMAACNARGIAVCNTGSQHSTATTAELALALLLAAARRVPEADRSMRRWNFQSDVPLGFMLEGRTLGVIGLGKIGSRMARYGQALGMHVIAWSQNMTKEQAQAAGARLVDKNTLLAESDAISLHVVLSDRTCGILGAEDLARMKPGAILVNTSRGPLVDEAALVAALSEGRIVAGLDVYGEEPLPAAHPLRSSRNTVLTPHLGYCTSEIYQQFYRESIENILAFLAGKPIRVINPEALKS